MTTAATVAAPPSIQVTTDFITPETAAAWLKTSAHNRPLSKNWARALAREIVHDRFKFTHQAIAFNKRGELIDGQHRLHAVTIAERGVWFLVVRGLADDALLAIDTGKIRTLADIANLSAIMKDKVVVQVASFLMRHEYSVVKPSAAQLAYFLAVHASAISAATQILPRRSRSGFSTAPLQAAMTRATYHADHGRLKEFAELLEDPTTDAREDSGVVRLHSLLALAKKKGERPVDAILYGKATTALRAFALREFVEKLTMLPTDPFPLPPVPELLAEEQEDQASGGAA
jgi:hypothetical protein